jgi:multicomponent Na+:H+ antiporter subunit C
VTSLAFFSIALIVVGLYGVLAKVNLLKVVLGVVIMCLGVAVLVVGGGGDGETVSDISQTVGLVAVVGGASVASLLTVTAVRLYEKYGSLDIREMRRLKG